jgi:hypothetical protein
MLSLPFDAATEICQCSQRFKATSTEPEKCTSRIYERAVFMNDSPGLLSQKIRHAGALITPMVLTLALSSGSRV